MKEDILNRQAQGRVGMPEQQRDMGKCTVIRCWLRRRDRCGLASHRRNSRYGMPSESRGPQPDETCTLDYNENSPRANTPWTTNSRAGPGSAVYEPGREHLPSIRPQSLNGIDW